MIRASVKLDLRPLQALRGRKARLAVKIGVQRAAKPVKESVTNDADGIRLTGLLAKSIGTKVKQYTDAVIAVIGPKTKFKRVTRARKGKPAKVRRPAKYASFLVKGTKRSRKRDFLTPTLDAMKDRYEQQLAAEIETEIMKVLSAAGG